jgi:Zinc finger, C2H2 type
MNLENNQSCSIKPFKCEICHKGFETNGNLLRHMKKKNKCFAADNEKYKCDICGKKFQKKSNYNDHLNRKNQCRHPSITHDEFNQLSEKMNIISKYIKIPQNQMQPELLINIENSNNNTTNTSNSHNNTMNASSSTCLINYVVNQYPNAKNIEDCIKLENIPKMTLTECEDLYFTDGAMKIFKGLCDLGEENRPIHCTDASRCNYIYKSNDVWKIDVGGEVIRNHFFPVIQDAYTQVHKNRIKNNPGNSTIIGNYLTEMTGTNVKKICQKTLKRLSNDFLAKNSKNSKLIKSQKVKNA